MNVYVVFTYRGYEDFDVLGVFDDKELAISAYHDAYVGGMINTEWNNADPFKNCHIREFTVNEVVGD